MTQHSPCHYTAWTRFIHSESAGGLCLMFASALAILLANTPWGSGLQHLWHVPIGGMVIELWVNDALMSLFFLTVGLEIKEEMCHGQLSSWRARALPGMAALGGMIVPALIFIAFNTGDAGRLKGWAIPAATDIAFALAVVTLLGKRVPASLKTFLAALAVIDDLGAILIIALFYTQSLSWPMLAGAICALGVLVLLNRLKVGRLLPYLLVGAVLWYFMFHSGIHATLAGVLLALCIPLDLPAGYEAPLHRLNRRLSPWVSFGVLPMFGLANAGVALSTEAMAHALSAVPLGIAAGLTLGKPLGIVLMSWVTVQLKLSPMPAGARWSTLLATALLCGIGFTMSLFIGGLAYAGHSDRLDEVKLGVLAGSLLSTAAGVLLFRHLARPARL